MFSIITIIHDSQAKRHCFRAPFSGFPRANRTVQQVLSWFSHLESCFEHDSSGLSALIQQPELPMSCHAYGAIYSVIWLVNSFATTLRIFESPPRFQRSSPSSGPTVWLDRPHSYLNTFMREKLSSRVLPDFRILSKFIDTSY